MTSTSPPLALPRAGGGRATTGVVAGGAAAVAVAACVVAAALLTAAGAWRVPGAADAPVDLAVGTAYPLMGALVLAHGRGSRTVGLLLLAAGGCAALAALTTAIAVSAVEPTPWVRLAAQASSALWVPGFLPLLTLLPLVFPDGLLPGRVWRAVRAVSVAAIGLFTVAVALHPDPVLGRVTVAKLVVAEPVARLLAPVAVPLLVVGMAGALASLVVRLRRSQGLVRRQVVVLLWAAALLALDVALQPVLPSPVDVLSQAAAVALLPVAVGVAVTRHRLYDLDLAICRTLAGASLAGCLAGLYLTAFALLQAAVGGRTALASGLAAGVTGLVVLPLGTRLTRGVDRLFYGDRADGYLVLSGFTASLRGRLDVAEVPQAVCDAIVGSLRLGSATLELPGGRRAAAGVAVGPATAVPLRHRGTELGVLTVTPRDGEAALDPRDVDLVSALADSAAPAVAALELTDSLQRAREHLVAAREEERRRVRRDLHDGVGAALAGVRLQLDSARELVSDPVAGGLLDAAAGGVAEAVRDVRHVTDDLRPPALDDLGLRASLAALADRVRTPALDVTVDVADLPPLPAAVDVACYRVVAEALANAARHARARHVTVTLRVADGRLHLAVVDDGCGLPAVPQPRGLGIRSMRQRAEEIGGRCTVDSTGAGTAVRVTLPVDVR